jgi:hypothetical protein
MRTFARKPKATKHTASPITMKAHRAFDGQRREVSSILRLQRTIEGQTIKWLRQAEPDRVEARSVSKEPTRICHDFRQVPVFPTPAMVNWPGSHAETRRAYGLLANREFQFLEGKPKKGGEQNKPEPEKPPSREPCDTKCGISGGPLGSTECELDLKSGLLTGKVTKEVFDKSACTRPCVEVHEGVHAKKIAPTCSAAKKCLDAAGGDVKKQDKCLDKFQADLGALTFSTECAAYTAEEECLNKRARNAKCKSTDGKKRWDEQMKMVKCYKGCFCKG